MPLSLAPFPEQNLGPLQQALAQSQNQLSQNSASQIANSQFAQKLDYEAQKTGREEASNAIHQAFTLMAQAQMNSAKLQMERETNANNKEINLLKLAMAQKENEANLAYKNAQSDISQQRADEYARHNSAMESKPSGGKAPSASEILAGVESGAPVASLPEDTGSPATAADVAAITNPPASTVSPQGTLPGVAGGTPISTETVPTAPVAQVESPAPTATDLPDWSKLGISEGKGLKAVQELEAQLSSGGTISEDTIAKIALTHGGATPEGVALRDTLNAYTPTLKANLSARETAQKDASAATKKAVEQEVKLQEKQTTLSAMLKTMTPEQKAKVEPMVNDLIDSKKDFDLAKITQRIDDAISPEKDTTRLQLTEITSMISDLDKQYKIESDGWTGQGNSTSDPEFKPIRDKYAADRKALADKKLTLFNKTQGKTTSPARNNYKPPFPALTTRPAAGADVYFR